MISHSVIHQRAIESQARLLTHRNGMASRLEQSYGDGAKRDITIYATGSLARLEASKHSDLDAFFYVLGNKTDDRLNTVDEVRVFHNVIEASRTADFPDFSNGGEYLHFQYLDEVLKNIGSRQDDYINGLTTRMLMILVSCFLFNEENFRFRGQSFT